MLSLSKITQRLILSRANSTLLKHPRLPLGIDLEKLPLLDESTLSQVPEQQKWAKEVTIDYGRKQLEVDYSQPSQALPTVCEVVSTLNLDALYSNLKKINELKNKIFLGFHGGSANGAPIVMPAIDPQQYGNQGSYHSNPNPSNNSFHIANTLRAAMHYANINSISGSSYRNYEFYDDAIVMICCADPLAVEEQYDHGPLIAWNYQKHRQQTLGEECLIPPEKHADILNLGLFRIKGRKRTFPLKEGQTIYHERKPHILTNGELIAMENESPQRPII